MYLHEFWTSTYVMLNVNVLMLVKCQNVDIKTMYLCLSPEYTEHFSHSLAVQWKPDLLNINFICVQSLLTHHFDLTSPSGIRALWLLHGSLILLDQLLHIHWPKFDQNQSLTTFSFYYNTHLLVVSISFYNVIYFHSFFFFFYLDLVLMLGESEHCTKPSPAKIFNGV